jgi:hypothetical protein
MNLVAPRSLRPTSDASRTSTSTSTSTATSTATSTLAPPGEGLLSRVKKWGVTAVVAAGLIIPATIGLQIMNAPRSPVDLPVPPAITQPVQPPTQDVFVPPRPTQPAPPVVVAPPAQPVSPPVVSPPTAPPVVTPEQPTEQPPAVLTFVQHVQRAFVDGHLDVAEAKTLARALTGAGAQATTADWQLLATAYKDSRTTGDARAVLDTVFVRAGVPTGAGADHVVRVVEDAAARDALGPALRGRLQTGQLLRLDVAPSAELPRGATVWMAPGQRPQAFVEIPGQGAFGPLLTAVRGGQS